MNKIFVRLILLLLHCLFPYDVQGLPQVKKESDGSTAEHDELIALLDLEFLRGETPGSREVQQLVPGGGHASTLAEGSRAPWQGLQPWQHNHQPPKGVFPPRPPYNQPVHPIPATRPWGVGGPILTAPPRVPTDPRSPTVGAGAAGDDAGGKTAKPEGIDWSTLTLAKAFPGGRCLVSDGRIGDCKAVYLPCGVNFEKESPEMCDRAFGTKCCVALDPAKGDLGKNAEVFPGSKCKVMDGRVGDCKDMTERCEGADDDQGGDNRDDGVCIAGLYKCCLPGRGSKQLTVVSRSGPNGCKISDGREGVCVPVHEPCVPGTEHPGQDSMCSLVFGLKCCVGDAAAKNAALPKTPTSP